MRRGTPEFVVAGLIAILLATYIWYTQTVARNLQQEGARLSRMFGQVYHAFGDTASDQAQTLLDLSAAIRDQGVPIVIVDRHGVVGAHANLPPAIDTLPNDNPRIRDYIKTLDAQNPPLFDPVIGEVHFGYTPLVQGLRVIPTLQALIAALLVLAGVYIIRTRSSAARERLWAGRARESAHQLGTPLSSLAGWIELLEDRAHDPTTQAAVAHMRGDLDRLDRVAHRFERIGREGKLDPLDVGALVERVAGYFRARVPALANTVQIESAIAPNLPALEGDPVLLEWALEVLTKNAIDALAGRGGRVRLSAETNGDGAVRIKVADNGPGIPRELRTRIFEPGFSTKQSGWGIGLALAKRIVEENHEGTLAPAPAEPGESGATFEIILH